MPISLTHFAARAGDHNDRAMVASGHLAAVLGERLSAATTVIGEPQPAEPANWDLELDAAMPALRAMASRFELVFGAGDVPVTALSRCAVALATLPVVASHRPDAIVVWFDAHADLNTPENTSSGFLGGLALSGPLGLWNSGLGGGLAPANAILVGTRDLDPAEQELVDDGTIRLVPGGPEMAAELQRAVAGRPVYVHIDCDVLEPGLVPTDYRVPHGMSLGQLDECAEVLAQARSSASRSASSRHPMAMPIRSAPLARSSRRSSRSCGTSSARRSREDLQPVAVAAVDGIVDVEAADEDGVGDPKPAALEGLEKNRANGMISGDIASRRCWGAPRRRCPAVPEMR
ncbi:arginase family protein [Agromyces sp. Marseille-Q5079]|uniref:arginase family protein n=1 Tax=Agromyces sp. Marseille-Q5079 TaxID=3439059 RepID=UPI003D9C88A7